MTATINASTSSGIVQTADTSGALALQSNGTTQFTVDSTGAYGQLLRGTAVATTSGTSITFFSLPSWIKRITVMFNGVSTNGVSLVQVQIGSGSVTTSGYSSSCSNVYGTNLCAVGTSTSGFTTQNGNAALNRLGHMIITNVNGNTWVASYAFGGSGSSNNEVGGGIVTLSGTLDRVVLTTVNGTDTFDAGSVNILYEG
jgi:hypothetical protein